MPEHLRTVKERAERNADRVLAAVQDRLVREINHWQNRRLRIQEEIAAGKVPRVTLGNIDRILDDLTNRLRSRQIELAAMREVSSATPVVLGGALVIPAGLLAKRRGEPLAGALGPRMLRLAGASSGSQWICSRSRAGARSPGLRYVGPEVRMGYYQPASRGARLPLPEPRHIEVKGRIQGSDTITVTSDEIMYGLNQREKFLLAIVLVEGEPPNGPYYIRYPYARARLGNDQRQPQPEIFVFAGRARVSELIPHRIKQKYRRQESAQAH